MTALRQGQIVWTPVCDNHGNPPKHHPVIVISETADNEQNDTAIGVVTSHSAALRQPRPPHFLPLPHHPNRNCSTRFKRESVAVCDWIVVIPSKVEDYGSEDIGGSVITRDLVVVMRKIEEIRQEKLRQAARRPPQI